MVAVGAPIGLLLSAKLSEVEQRCPSELITSELLALV